MALFGCRSPEHALSAAARSAVHLRCGKDLGSGAVVGRGDRIVTNAHVVACASRGGLVELRAAGALEWTSARVAWADSALDLAVLSTPSIVGEPLSLVADGAASPPDPVWAIGYPAGTFVRDQPSFTNGVYSAVATDANGRRLIQHSATLNPGNSGGPLVDACGRLVGVNTLRISDLTNVGYAIRASVLSTPLRASGIAAVAFERSRCSPAAQTPWAAAGVVVALAGLGAAAVRWRRPPAAPQQAPPTRADSLVPTRAYAAPGASPGLVLTAVGGVLAGKRWPLTTAELAIGRDPEECAILLDEALTAVSRRHCTVTRSPDGGATLVDDGSTNGTFTTRGRLDPGQPVTLYAGERFWLGTPDIAFALTRETT